MTTPVSNYATVTAAIAAPTLFAPQGQIAGLSDTERRVMNHLGGQVLDAKYRSELILSLLYAEGMNLIPSLGIAVPPELEALRAVLSWCGAAIAARSERLSLQGFRIPGQSTVDDDLQRAWQYNDLDFESVLVHTDALTFRNSFVIVSPNPKWPNGVPQDELPPVSAIESPLNMQVSWDVRRREVSAAYRTYWDVDPASETFGHQLAHLYTRESTILMVSAGGGSWKVDNRNDHKFGRVPVVMHANRPTALNRYGCSEIAPSWRNTQDRAARGLVRNEIAAEFFASMKLWLLGVEPDSFKKRDGSPATSWETFTGRLSTLQADKYGNLPSIVFQQGQDPAGLIKFIDHERQVFSGNSGTPLDYLGLVSEGNPTSGDAIGKGDFRLRKCAERLSVQFGNNWEDWARLTLKIWGKDTTGTEQLEAEWGKFGIPTPSADVVNVTAQIAAGMIAPNDDDGLAECGWTPIQRQRISDNLTRHGGAAGLDNSIEGLKPPAQALDGEQPAAKLALQQHRDATNGA